MEFDLRKLQLEMVTWEDAQGCHGWTHRGPFEEWATKDNMRCVSVGWVTHETKTFIVMVETLATTNCDEVGCGTKIPKGWIIDRKELAIRKKKRSRPRKKKANQ